MTTERLSSVEKAIVRLTVVQEVQTKQSDTQSKQMDALLENSSITRVIADSIKEHNTQIVDLYTKISKNVESQHRIENELNANLTDTRSALNRASYGRLVLAITVATGITWKLFIMNKEDIDNILTTKTTVLQRILVLEKDTEHLHKHLELQKLGPRK